MHGECSIARSSARAKRIERALVVLDRGHKQESTISKNGGRQVKCGSEKHRPLLSKRGTISAAEFYSCLTRRIIGRTPDVLPSARANRETDRNKQRENRGGSVKKKRGKAGASEQNRRERERKRKEKRFHPGSRVRTQVATTLRSGILTSNEDKQEESPPRKNDRPHRPGRSHRCTPCCSSVRTNVVEEKRGGESRLCSERVRARERERVKEREHSPPTGKDRKSVV